MSKNYRQLKRPESVHRQLESWGSMVSNRERRKAQRFMYRSPCLIASARQMHPTFKRRTSSGRFVAFHHGQPDYYGGRID